MTIRTLLDAAAGSSSAPVINYTYTVYNSTSNPVKDAIGFNGGIAFTGRMDTLQNVTTGLVNLSTGVISNFRKSTAYGYTNTFNLAKNTAGTAYYVASTQSVNFQTDGVRITKFDTSNTQQWSLKLVDSGTTNGSVAVDSNENVIAGATGVLGYVKINSAGTSIVAARKISNATNPNFYSVTVDSSNNIYVLGDAEVSTSTRPVILKYNSSNTLVGQWLVVRGGAASGLNAAGCFKCDRFGNLYFGFRIYSAGVNYGYLIRLDSAGNFNLQYSFPNETNVTSICFDSLDNIYILCANVITKFDQNFNVQWQRTVSATANSINIIEDKLVVVGQNGTRGFILTLPLDGSKTGTITLPSLGSITYSVTTQSFSASGNISVTASTYTDAASLYFSLAEGSGFGIATPTQGSKII